MGESSQPITVASGKRLAMGYASVPQPEPRSIIFPTVASGIRSMMGGYGFPPSLGMGAMRAMP